MENHILITHGTIKAFKTKEIWQDIFTKFYPILCPVIMKWTILPYYWQKVVAVQSNPKSRGKAEFVKVLFVHFFVSGPLPFPSTDL